MYQCQSTCHFAPNAIRNRAAAAERWILCVFILVWWCLTPNWFGLVYFFQNSTRLSNLVWWCWWWQSPSNFSLGRFYICCFLKWYMTFKISTNMFNLIFKHGAHLETQKKVLDELAWRHVSSVVFHISGILRPSTRTNQTLIFCSLRKQPKK